VADVDRDGFVEMARMDLDSVRGNLAAASAYLGSAAKEGSDRDVRAARRVIARAVADLRDIDEGLSAVVGVRG